MERATKVRTLLTGFIVLLALAVVSSWNALYWFTIALLLAAAGTAAWAGHTVRQ
jgi:hypothetical protein